MLRESLTHRVYLPSINQKLWMKCHCWCTCYKKCTTLREDVYEEEEQYRKSLHLHLEQILKSLQFQLEPKLLKKKKSVPEKGGGISLLQLVAD